MSRPTSPEEPQKLRTDHVVDGFDSGAPELDHWLVRFAYENHRANNATTYVAAIGQRVVGYYAIAMAGVSRDDVPARLARARPAHVPGVLLARLAVDRSVQGRGLGAGLLTDALRRSVVLSDAIGAAAFLVHARDEAAKSFYLANGDFLESPSDPLHLLAPMKDLRRIFGAR